MGHSFDRRVLRRRFQGRSQHEIGNLCALAVAIGAAIGAPTGARAQAPAQAGGLEEVLVTGTRIQQSGMDTPTPVTQVTLDELDSMEPGQLVESLSQLPVFFNNQRPQTTGFPSSAGSNLDLRGAGANRTLVLLDGRRIPNGNRFGTANISALPEGAIRSVETVTGGASAAYGTDAVAGVVNFILDKDFTGFAGHLQAGQTTRSDGDNYELGGTYGRDLGENGHFIVSADQFDQDAIISLDALRDRPWFRQRAWVTNPTPGGPTFITRDFVSQTNVSTGGIINQPGSALNKLEFVTNNGVTTTVPLAFSGVGQLQGGCNCQAEPTRDPTWGMDADNAVLSENERNSLFFHTDFDVTENLNLYGQLIRGYARVRGPWFSAPVLLGPWQATIFSGNPYLPANVQAIMDQEGLASFGFGMTGDNQWENPSPIGTYTIEQEDTMNTGTLGFELDLTGDGFFGDWTLRGYTQFGRNEQIQRFENGVRMGRLPIMMDVVRHPVTGQPACRAAVVNPGTFGDCVPINLFGGTRNVSREAAAYLVDPEKIIDTTSEQWFTEFVVDGRVAEGWAGPIFMALGASHRKDEIYQYVPDLTDEFVFLNGVNTGLRGLVPEDVPGIGMLGVRPGSVPPGFTGAANLAQVLFTGSFQTPDTVLAGSFQVREAFAEINVPLVQGKRAARQLDANFAYRYADYTGSGGIDSWKYGISWQIVEQLRFRATGSRDVRAATLRERFDATAGGAQVLDPVFNNASIGTASRSGGNPFVNPEKADTVTYGFVYQPSAIDGFSLSVDWYDIDVEDALGQLSFQNIVDGCFRGAQDLCRYVIRDPVSNVITRIDSLFLNINRQILRGVDLETRYTRQLGEGQLTWRLLMSRVDENSLTFPGAPKDYFNRERPKYVAVTNVGWSRGPFTVFVNKRWLDGHLLNRNFVEGINVDENDVPSWAVTDLNLTYELPLRGGDTWSLFLNVTNLFDKDPPQTPGAPGFVGGTAGPSALLYDTIGRRFVVGANLKF